jgi:hypothetical protein
VALSDRYRVGEVAWNVGNGAPGQVLEFAVPCGLGGISERKKPGVWGLLLSPVSYVALSKSVNLPKPPLVYL